MSCRERSNGRNTAPKRTSGRTDAQSGSKAWRIVDWAIGLAMNGDFPHPFRMSSFLFWVAAAGMFPLGGEARPSSPHPSDKWVINFADNRCEATHAFGSAAHPVYFMIKPSPTSGVVQLVLVRAGHKYNALQDRISLSFGSGKPIELSQLRYGTPTQDVRMVNLDAEVAARLKDASTLKWSGPATDYQLALGNMAQVMKVLANCRDDLRKYWNIEPALSSALREPPAPLKPLPKAFSTDDYPAEAVNNNQSGTAGIVMLVDEKGQLADCMLDETSGVPTLDAMTCIIIKQRVKFRPAVGSDGKPVRAALTTRIRWEMGE